MCWFLRSSLSPARFFIERGLGKPAQSVDCFSVTGDCAGGEQGTGWLVHEGHEFIGKAGHGTADTNATYVGASAYACHPTTLPNIALNNGPPTSQLHDALSLAVPGGEVSLFIVATPVTSFMDRLTKQPGWAQTLVEGDQARPTGSHMKQIKQCLHEIIRLHRTSRDAHERDVGPRSPFPPQVIRQPHAPCGISLHRMNATVGCARPGSNDGPGLRSQAVDPIARKDRLAGFLICPKGRPIPFGLILFVRNRSFDHQDERGEVTCGSAMKRLQEVFAVLVGEAWIMEVYFWNPGQSLREEYPARLGCVAAVMEMVSPSQPSPAVIQSTSISAKGGVSRDGWLLVIQATPMFDRPRGGGSGGGGRQMTLREATSQIRHAYFFSKLPPT